MSHTRFLVNIVSNVTNFTFSVLVGIWLTPYLIRHLGVSAYGLIPLAATVTSYLGLFTMALYSSVGRYMTMALDRKDYEEANRLFNTSFWTSVWILILLLGPCIWFSMHSYWFLDVPNGMERDFTWLIMALLGMFYLTTIAGIFSITSFCRNRFDLTNAINILNTIVRIVIIILLFVLFQPRVWHVGVAMLIASVISFLGAILVWHHLTPMLHLRPSWFSLTSLRALAGMSGWIVVNTFGSLLYLSIDIVVVNILLGPEATGRYGAVLTWPVLLRSFAGVIAAVFGPTIFRLYSRGDLNELVIYSCRAVKCIGLVLAIPIGLICGMAKPLLYLWLGEEYVPLASLMSLMTFHLSVNLAVLPLFNIQVATNHVRLPCIVTCAMGLMNLVLAIALIRLVGWGMYSVAAAGAVMLTVKNIVFTPIYAARILGIYWTTYYINMLPVACITLFLIMLGWAVSYCLSIRSWLGLAAFAFPLSALTAVLIYAMALNRNERSLLMRLLVWRNTVAHK